MDIWADDNEPPSSRTQWPHGSDAREWKSLDSWRRCRWQPGNVRASVWRVDEARVLGRRDAHYLEQLQRGLAIDGRRMRASEVALLPMKGDAKGATLIITLREGRNRQVRNMCEAIGHPVDHLKRVAIGPLRDARLKVGFWRDLTEDEVKRLQKAAAAAGKQPAGTARTATVKRPEPKG